MNAEQINSPIAQVRPPRATWRALAVAALAATLFTGCETLGTTDDDAAEPDLTQTTPEPATETVTTPDEATSPEPEVDANATVSDLTQTAIELLGRGDQDFALFHLDRALEKQPKSVIVNKLRDQLITEPEEYLGSTSYSYTVKPGETLSVIAQRYLGDRLKFPILARYNQIANPQSLVAGTVIRLPGTPQPDPVAPDAGQLLKDAAKAEAEGDVERAYSQARRAVELEPANTTAGDTASRLRTALIDALSNEAYALEKRRQLPDALAKWQQILELDDTAVAAQINVKRLEKQISEN